MIRLTLHQFRTEAAISVGLLGALAIVLALTGPHLAEVSRAFEQTCRAAGNCSAASDPAFALDRPLQGFLQFLVAVTPALIGVFFGAPLVARELETGTFELAWTQSVTRERWLAVKLGLVGLAAMVVSGLLTWMTDWWMSPLDAVNRNRFDPGNFSVHGVVPIGYAAFAFVLGVAAGLVLRRTLPGIAATIVGFVVARLAVERWVRPHLAAPIHESLSLLRTGNFGTLAFNASTGGVTILPPQVTIPNAWVLSTAVVDRSGRAITSTQLLRACPKYGGGQLNPSNIRQVHDACIATLSTMFHTAVSYQPANRFWPFQWAETGIFLLAGLAICAFISWWLQR
jgi:hypothetical protein